MDFETVRKYLESLRSYENELHKLEYNEKNFDLENFKAFLLDFGVKFLDLKVIQVAGSKGKGSVCSLIQRYLTDSGFRVGLFTSPYILDIRECFRIDGRLISRQEFARLAESLKQFLDKTSWKITRFEALTTLAFKYFIEQKVNFAVIEVGLGGRLDATSVVRPEVAVLTRIELEHTNLLGGSYGEILAEKLAIFKPGVKGVIGLQNSEVCDILREKFLAKAGEQKIEMMGKLKTGMMAIDQNFRLAERVLKLIFGGKFVPERLENLKLQEGLFGRFSVRQFAGKTVIFDMAHTPGSMENLFFRLGNQFSGSSFLFFLGFLEDKNVSGMFDLLKKFLAGHHGRVVFCLADQARGVCPRHLFEMAVSEGLKVEMAVSEFPKKTFSDLLQGLEDNEVVVVAGSHYLVKLLAGNLKLS